MNLIHRNIMWRKMLSGLLLMSFLSVSCRLTRNTPQSAVIAGYTSSPYSSSQAVWDNTQIPTDSLFIEAEREKIQGNLSKAAELFELFLQANPQNAAASYELALLNGRSKNNTGTLQYARKAAMLDTTNSWYQIAFANALAMNTQFDSAAEIFHRLSIRNPAQDRYAYNEAVMRSNAEQYPEALSLFNKLEDEAGINEEFVYQKQRIYLKMGKPDSAAAEIQKLIDLYPDNSRYYGLLAQVYADNNQPSRAIAVYQNLLQKYPDNPQAMVALGVYYKNKGDDSAYRNYMKQAFGNPQFNLEDKIAFIYPYLKYVEIDSGKKQEALFLCNLIVNAHPNSAAAHTIYGEMFFQCGQTDSAEHEFQTAIGLDSTQFEPVNQLLILYASKGSYENLLTTGQDAISRFPNEGSGWYFYGIANFSTGKYESSIEMLKKALSIGVNDKALKGHIYATLGEAYHQLKQYPSSDSCFSLSLHLNPKDAYTLNNFSYYLAERQEHLDQALLMIQTAVKLQPDLAVFEDTYAWVLFRMKRYKEAKQWMEKALEHSASENHPGYLEHYGDILYKNEEKAKAVQYWQKAIQEGGSSQELTWKIKHKKMPRKT